MSSTGAGVRSSLSVDRPLGRLILSDDQIPLRFMYKEADTCAVCCSTICLRARSRPMAVSSRSSTPRRPWRTVGTCRTQAAKHVGWDYSLTLSPHSTTIGIKCTDGIIMGVEKTLLSKMLVKGTHRRIYAIDRHVGLSMAGLVADGRQLVNRAREEALSYKKNYGSAIPPDVLADRMGQYVHYYTLYGSIRPFGTAVMIAGYDADEKKASLHMVEPSGVTYVRLLGIFLPATCAD